MELSDSAMDRLACCHFTEAMTTTLSARRRPMIDSYSRVLTLVTALGAGLNAGVFFAFSSFVMSALRRLGQPSSVYQLAGVALYLVAFVVTAAYHVPRNDALALVDPNATGAAQTWAHYFSG